MLLPLFALALAQDPPPPVADVGPTADEPCVTPEPIEGADGVDPVLALDGQPPCAAVVPPPPEPDLYMGLVGPDARRASPYTSADQLPDVVRIKTFYQGYNNHHYFALVDGIIYAKERTFVGPGEPEVVSPGAWAPFEGSGLPYREKSDGKTTNLRGWDDTDAIQRISADDDELVALGTNNRVYWKRIHDTPRFDDQWYDEWGFPIRMAFEMPQHGLDALAWDIGRRRIGSTGYFVDPSGDPHVSGFGISTMYLLATDQHTIWFADTGLPPRLSHRMCGPERSTVKAVNLTASASTIMLIDHAGQIWTRLADYDTTGSTPGHRYNYDDEPLDGMDPYDVRTIDTNMQLPPEDWVQQPPIFADGRPDWAHLSQEISLHQNGEGNDARELRVMGTNAEGALGYYRKQLTDPNWDFVESDFSLAGVAWLDDAEVDTPVTRYAESWDSELSGILRAGGQDYPVSISGWNPVCTPAQATVTLPGGGTVDFGLHSVDAWTPWREINPGFDGTTEASLGTVWFEDEDLESSDPEVQALMAAIGHLHRDAFALWIDGNTEGLVLDTKGVRESVEIIAVEGGASTWAEAKEAAREIEEPSTYVAIAGLPHFQIDVATASAGQLRDAIAANQALRGDLRRGLEEEKDLAGYRKSRRQSRRLTNTLFVVNGVLRVTGIRLVGRIGDWRRPNARRSTKFTVWTSKVSMVFENTTGMILRSKKKDRRELKAARADYREAVDVLDARIDAYEGALESASE